jgi:hypothetical protein
MTFDASLYFGREQAALSVTDGCHWRAVIGHSHTSAPDLMVKIAHIARSLTKQTMPLRFQPLRGRTRPVPVKAARKGLTWHHPDEER